MLNEDVGSGKRQKVVQDRPIVQLPFDARHQMLFNASDCHSVILKAESFVLVVNHGLPQPDREHNLLPKRKLMVVAVLIMQIMIKLFLDLNH